jgi:CRISPR-associated endonuclease Cas1
MALARAQTRRPSRPASERPVLALTGYGLRLSVQRGHLVLEDGIADRRRVHRLSRIDRQVKRIAIIGHAGTISLDAIRWLHDVKIPLIHLDTDGRVLALVGPDAPDHPQLRRGQALAAHCNEGLEIARRLLTHKLAGQGELVRELVWGQVALGPLEVARRALQKATDMIGLRTAEAHAAAAYWRAWEHVPVAFTRKDEASVPAHWRRFGNRSSPLTGSPRLAANPANALLNYQYSILEAEARIALLAVGCDPGLGIQHADQGARDSMACDVMEAIRPRVDAWLLSYLESRVFAKREFFEARNGNCRLMPVVAAELAQTAELWAGALGPVVEDIAQHLHRLGAEHGRRRWLLHRAPSREPARVRQLPTPLTEQNRQRARPRRGGNTEPVRTNEWPRLLPLPGSLPVAGDDERRGQSARPLLLTEADLRQDQHHRLVRLLAGFEPMTRESFLHAILPALREISAEVIAARVGLSVSYCAKIRAGACVPRKKHWQAFRSAVAERDRQ